MNRKVHARRMKRCDNVVDASPYWPAVRVSWRGLLAWRPLVHPANDCRRISARARQLHFSSHGDRHPRRYHAAFPARNFAPDGSFHPDLTFDFAARDSRGSVDIPRMRAGGFGAIFFSIWIPSKITGPISRKARSRTNRRGPRTGALPSPRSCLRHHRRRNSRRASRRAKSLHSSASKAAT